MLMKEQHPWEVFLTGGYPLGVFFFPCLLQNSPAKPSLSCSCAQLCQGSGIFLGMAAALAAISPAFGIPRAGDGALV